MPQYQGVWTLEQQAQAQSNQQWVTDPNFKNTTLLLQADGTGSGSQNNTFLDGSTNNFFITRNGNTTQGSFSPFSQAPGYWSNYFNGSSTISAASNSAFNILAYDTFECWVNMAVLGTNDLIAGRDGNFWLGYNHTSISGASNKFVFSIWNGSAWQAVSSTTSPVVGTWYHILGVKDNTTLRFYVNGVQESTSTFSGSPVTTGVFYVASNNNTENLEGYVSNLRLITGATNAVFPYSGLTTGASFTPPTSPLTAVSSTQLLTCQSNRFVDNSTNAFTLTPVSVPSVQAFGPFAPALQWTPDVVGGSGYFDGSGDYLTGPSASGGDFSTGSFTISCWFYPTTLTGGTNYGLISYADTGGWNGWQLQVRGSTKDILFEFLTGSAGASQITGGSIALNAWNYVAIVRSGSTVSMYVNSTTAATSTTNSTAYGAATSRVIVGADRTLGSSFIGYISNSKLVKQANAPASIPTAPDTATTNTSLLINYTNAGIYDGKMANNLETVGNAQVATSPVKYGSGSMYFDGTGDWLYNAVSTPNVAFGTGNFTVEMWVYPTSNPTNGPGTVIDARNGASSEGWVIRLFNDLSVGFYDGPANTYQQTAAGTISLNVWTHIACVRAGTVLTIYINGVALKTATLSNNLGTSWPFYIGNNYSAGYTYYGYLDDLRITKGVARYYANFTPPQQALPRQ